MDVDKDGFVTYMDLVLIFGFWFSACLILIICYGILDVCDRKGRRDDERNRDEQIMLVEPTDNFVVYDAEKDGDAMEGIVIENVACDNFSVDIPIIKELA